MPDVDAIDALVFDFDGVLTDNFVYVDDTGRESVRCTRADGLAFDALRTTRLKVFILSTETNAVVAARGKKLRVPVIQGQSDKGQAITTLAEREGLALSRVLFVGNDVNDLPAMSRCGYSACPADAHPSVKRIVTVILATAGGQGVARELVEDVLRITMPAETPHG